MLYELFSIIRVADPMAKSQEAKAVATNIGRLIINNRGVVRQILPLECKNLPKIMKKDQTRHFQGYHMLMLFDASPSVQTQISKILQKDPRVIRSSIMSVNTRKRLDIPLSFEKACGKESMLE